MLRIYITKAIRIWLMMFLCGKGITTKSQLDVTPTLPARCILIHSIMTLLLL